jgi:hypothetical protein
MLDLGSIVDSIRSLGALFSQAELDLAVRIGLALAVAVLAIEWAYDALMMPAGSWRCLEAQNEALRSDVAHYATQLARWHGHYAGLHARRLELHTEALIHGGRLPAPTLTIDAEVANATQS